MIDFSKLSHPVAGPFTIGTAPPPSFDTTVTIAGVGLAGNGVDADRVFKQLLQAERDGEADARRTLKTYCEADPEVISARRTADARREDLQAQVAGLAEARKKLDALRRDADRAALGAAGGVAPDFASMAALAVEVTERERHIEAVRRAVGQAEKVQQQAERFARRRASAALAAVYQERHDAAVRLVAEAVAAQAAEIVATRAAADASRRFPIE